MINLSIPLNDIERTILKYLFETDLKSTYFGHYATQSVIQNCVQAGTTGADAEDAISCLLDRGYLKGLHALGSTIPQHISLSEFGFEEACSLFTPDYDDLLETVGCHLLTLTEPEEAEVQAISEALGRPYLLTNHFISFFRKLGWVKIMREDSEYAQVTYVSPLLRRSLELEG